ALGPGLRGPAEQPRGAGLHRRAQSRRADARWRARVDVGRAGAAPGRARRAADQLLLRLGAGPRVSGDARALLSRPRLRRPPLALPRPTPRRAAPPPPPGRLGAVARLLRRGADERGGARADGRAIIPRRSPDRAAGVRAGRRAGDARPAWRRLRRARW